MRQNRQGQDACLPGGAELCCRELSAMSSGCHFTRQRLVALPWPWLLGPGPSFQLCKDRNFILSHGKRPPPPHHLCSTPSAIPLPPPRARAPFHGSTQSRLDRVIPKTSFPGFCQISLTGKVTVTKMSHPNLAQLCTRP